jgi:amino acid permease
MLNHLLVEVVIIVAALIIWMVFWSLFGYMLRHFDVIQDEEKEEK